LLFATTHYRQELDFTDEALASAREGSRRLGEFAARLGQQGVVERGEFDMIALALGDEFGAAMDDDLNTSQALAALFEAARAGNRALDAGEQPTQAFLTIWNGMTSVLQVLPARRQSLSSQVHATSHVTGVLSAVFPEKAPSNVARQAEWAEFWNGRRAEAKGRRDFAESDRIRALLAEHGWEVRDNRDGTAMVQRK
jgi:cysteinyl-tRNA synthetase